MQTTNLEEDNNINLIFSIIHHLKIIIYKR